MYLVSVNRGKAEPIKAKRSGLSGIFKKPQDGPVAILESGLEGDTICDTKHHGGPDQAIYVYGSADYAWWSAELGFELEPGTFGENLTISEFESASAQIGDRFKIGEVILEITAPRIPCATLSARMGDRSFLKRFRAAERPGAYCRVIQPGTVQAGDPVEFIPTDQPLVGLIESFRYFFEPDGKIETVRRFLAAPIAIRDRQEKEEYLAHLLAQSK
jgi:Uncharacterized protein conserved in bacteria